MVECLVIRISHATLAAAIAFPYPLHSKPSGIAELTWSADMASSASPLLLPLGPASSGNRFSTKHHDAKVRGLLLHCSTSDSKLHPASRTRKSDDAYTLFMRRRSLIISVVLGVPTTMLYNSSDANSAGLPPEDKPKLCDEACEKDLENVPMVTTESGLQYKDIKVGSGPSPPVGFQVAANYVAMVPSGQVFDSSLEKGQIYIFRVGSGQVIKGLDEGILNMKVGGKRRLYIPGPLAFPKGLNSAPGRPRVAPNSPVVFDVSLEYIPGLEVDEE